MSLTQAWVPSELTGAVDSPLITLYGFTGGGSIQSSFGAGDGGGLLGHEDDDEWEDFCEDGTLEFCDEELEQGQLQCELEFLITGGGVGELLGGILGGILLDAGIVVILLLLHEPIEPEAAGALAADGTEAADAAVLVKVFVFFKDSLILSFLFSLFWKKAGSSFLNVFISSDDTKI